jgi:RNA polymerase sigma-70 factor (ECF subfamily)
MQHISDGSLLGKLDGRHARKAGHELFTRHWRDTWRTAYGLAGDRELAEDAAQEAFLRLFRNPDRVDASRPLRPWLRAVVANIVIDELRRSRRLSFQPFDEELTEMADEDTPWMPAIDDPTVQALGRLSDEQRLIVLLRYWADLAIDEIADLLSLPAGTVMSRCGRALARLRKELEPHHV